MSFQFSGKLFLFGAFAALFLNEFAVDAQNFVTPAGDEDKFGNRSLSTDFIWTYSTPDISKTVISCGIASRAVIFKKHSERATVQSTFVGRAEVIDDVTANPARIGFKLNNLDFPDQHEYTCFMMFDSNSPLYSNKFIFKIYEIPVFSTCLAEGLSSDNTGANYFALIEDGVLNSTCYAYGNPVPDLTCTTYDKDNFPQNTLQAGKRNYTSLPIEQRMRFFNVKRAVTKVICVADGGVTGRVTMEQNVRVDYLPSEPRNVRLVQSTLSYIRITWDPPVEPGISVISDYFMEWTHPNQTITSINYTVLNQGNPVLDYTFKNLYPEQNYKVVMSAYNAVGQGKRTGEVTFQSVVKGGPGSRSTDSGLSGGSIAGIVIGVLCGIVLILIVVFFVLKKRREKARYPQTYVEEAVDYPSTGGMYSQVNKKKPMSSGANESTSGYPDIIHQANPVEQQPFVSNEPKQDNPSSTTYEKSRKEYV